jgi:nucleotide-binding universal stress UspA family protein
MAKAFRPTCDRYGHVTVQNDTSIAQKRDRPAPCGLTSSRPIPNRKRFRQKASSSAAMKRALKQILVPIDVTRIKVADLEPVFRFTRRLGAEVTFLHCYVTPRSFSFLRGPSALAEVLYHRNMVRAQLLRLESQLRKSFPKSKCWFTSGSPPEEILRASERINADLIIVPTSLDLISDCWTTASLIDELVRRANCPVLGVPGGEELFKHSKIRRRRDHGWSELNDSLNWNGIELP